MRKSELTRYDGVALTIIFIASIALVYVTTWRIDQMIGPSLAGAIAGVITGLAAFFFGGRAYLWIVGRDVRDS